MKWLYGGHTKELLPEGYLGALADYEGVEVLDHLEDIAKRVSEAIVISIA